MTLEEVSCNDEGPVLSNLLNSCQIPGLQAVSAVLGVHFLNPPGHPNAILRAKAALVGVVG